MCIQSEYVKQEEMRIAWWVTAAMHSCMCLEGRQGRPVLRQSHERRAHRAAGG